MTIETTEETSVSAELRAMEATYLELAKLDASAQERVLYWLNQRLRRSWPDPPDVEVEPF